MRHLLLLIFKMSVNIVQQILVNRKPLNQVLVGEHDSRNHTASAPAMGFCRSVFSAR